MVVEGEEILPRTKNNPDTLHSIQGPGGEKYVSAQAAHQIVNELLKQLFDERGHLAPYQEYVQDHGRAKQYSEDTTIKLLTRDASVRSLSLPNARYYNEQDVWGLKERLEPLKGKQPGVPHYTPETRQYVLTMLDKRGDLSIRTIARQVGIPAQTLNNWLRERRERAAVATH